MKLIAEMQEGRDYEHTNLKSSIIKAVFEKKIRFLLKLSHSDKVKIKLIERGFK